MDIKTGADLKKWRKNNRLTQRELAENTSYSASRLSHIESNDEILSKKLLREIEKLDSNLHPIAEPDPISKKMSLIKDYSTIYSKEINNIEESLVKLLTINIKEMGYDKTKIYLGHISDIFSLISQVDTITYSDTQEGKQIFTDLAKTLATSCIGINKIKKLRHVKNP